MTAATEKAQIVDWSGSGWPDPLPLADPGEPPPLPDNLLPDALAAFVSDVHERLSAPVEFAAVPLIASLGAVLGGRVALAPKVRDTWYEFPNLYAAIIGPPASKKSPAAEQALAFVRRLEEAAAERWIQGDFLELETKKADAEMCAHRIERDLKKKDPTGDPEALAKARRDLADAQQKIKVGPPRLTTSDATREKLEELLAANPRGILVIRDELAGWLVTLGSENRAGEREAFLSLWSGKNATQTDRIGRGSLAIPPVPVSIFGGIQPGKFRRYIEEAAAGGQGADGLLQRFVLMAPEIPEFKYVDDVPDKAAADRLHNIFRRLNQEPVSIGGTATTDVIELLHFDAEAQELATDWLTKSGKRASDEGKSGSELLGAWLGKRDKTFCALSLIFHAVQVADGRRDPGSVNLRCAEMAAGWCELLELHVRKVYGAHADPQGAGMAALASKIQVGAVVDGDRQRDIYRHHWEHLKTPEEVRAAVEALYARGWCDLEEVATGGSPTQEIRVNPKLQGAS